MADPNRQTQHSRLYGAAELPAATGTEAAEFDRSAIQDVGVPEPVLMENAGRGAAMVVQRLYPEGPVAALVGRGNNGGDALVALRSLAAWGRTVHAVAVTDALPASLLHGWPVPAVADDSAEAARILDGAAVILDGVLGTGIQGAPRERQARAIEAANRAPAPVVALDLPSGVDAATGQAPGAAIQAEVTVAFGWPKLGSLIPPGRVRSGRLVAVEIGFPPSSGAFGARVVTPGWAHEHVPRRAPETHKYEVGTLLLLAGGEGMAGAAVMAGRAAQRAGLGLLRIASSAGHREILQTTVPEAIFVDLADTAAVVAATRGATALAAGPGLGQGADAVRALDALMNLDAPTPLVLDADALTLAGRGSVTGLDAVGRLRPLVLTPHTGELERITGRTREDVRLDRVGVARDVAAVLGATVLLKGMPSVVASPDGAVRVDVVGTSDLATGGMGDVLTGVVASFLAQGAAPADAAALGLFFSGRAAALAHRGAGLVPDDVIDRLPEARDETGPGTSDLDLPFVSLDLAPPR